MTLEECYEKLNGDYSDVKSRLMSDSLIERFLLKYPDDKTMDELCEAVAAGDIREAFSAVHTIKGLALNLALSGLYRDAYELTEQLRSRDMQADKRLFENVKQSHQLVLDTIAAYKAEK